MKYGAGAPVVRQVAATPSSALAMVGVVAAPGVALDHAYEGASSVAACGLSPGLSVAPPLRGRAECDWLLPSCSSREATPCHMHHRDARCINGNENVCKTTDHRQSHRF